LQQSNSEPYILISAGEFSGDRLGGLLLKGCIKYFPDAKWRGLGGPEMQKEGVQSKFPFAQLGVTALEDILLQFAFFWRVRKRMYDLLADPLCRGFVAVDYPGLNLYLWKKAQKLGVPHIWVSPPQVWAWKKKRVENFKGEKVFTITPLEKDIYKQNGAKVYACEHPLLKECKASVLKRASESSLDATKKTLYLFPGSRYKQFLRNMPIYRDIAVKWKEKHKNGQVIWVHPQSEWVKSVAWTEDELHINDEEWRKNYKQGVAVCSPGTMSLELALRRVEHAIVLKVPFLYYMMGRFMVKVPFFGLASILTGTKFAEEVIFWRYPEARIKKIIEELSLSVSASFKTQKMEAHENLYRALSGEELGEAVPKIIGDWLNV
jgi:lipid-A-disaccharide synthase